MCSAQVHRSRLGGYRRRGRPDTDPEVIDTKRKLAVANLESYIERTVAAAPPLTAEQRDRLAALLRPAAGGDAA